MRQNAMTEADKQRRRRVLLDAAHRLFRERRDLPPVSDIAAAAGLAKGTVYLYFKSKEEIFVALLEDDFGKLFAALAAIIGSLPPAPDAAAARFAADFTKMVLALDNLLPLASLTNGVLEQNLPIEAMRRFKVILASGLISGGAQLQQLFPSLASGQGATLLLQTYALTLGLWQALDYPDLLRKLLEEPALKPLDRHFPAELEGAVRGLWRGTLAV